jgi:peptidoglycan/LPS O-acetylase OafA/YrhL
MSDTHPAAPDSARRDYRPELDILRAFAFLGVFTAHWVPDEVAYYTQRGFSPVLGRWLVAVAHAGATGVMLFFCLSSYLITGLLLREIERHGRVDVRAFYIRRILRIWPLYITFTVFAALLPLIDPEQVFGWKACLAFLLFSGNWVWTMGLSVHTVAVPLWSVSVEEQFYLVWPWVVRRATRTGLRNTAIGLIVLAQVNRVLVVCGWIRGDLWHNTFTQLDGIALGALIAIGVGDRATPARRFRVPVIAAAVVCVLLAQLLWSSTDTDPRNLLYYPLVSTSCAVVLFFTLDASLDASSRIVRIAVYLGKISFGLYVVHNFAFYGVEKLIRLLPRKLSPITSFGVLGVFAFALALGIAAASYKWLEKPFLRLKSRFGRVG